MTLNDALHDAYGWGVLHGTAILIAAVVIPLIGALGAELGKGGRTDEDGRAIASVVIGFGVIAMLGELIALHFAHAYFKASLLDADWRLALAPALCLASCLVAVRWVFPLSQLAGARSAFCLAGVFVGCWLLLRFFQLFQGWHMTVWTSLFQLVVVLAVACYGLWWRFKRALSLDEKR